MSLLRRSLPGMLTGAGSVALKTGLNLLLVPVLISRLGLESFGLYILLISLVEVSALLDMGTSSALATLLSGEAAVDSVTRRGLLKVGSLWFLLLTVVCLATGALFLPHFADRFHLAGPLRAVAQVGFLFVLLEAALSLYSSYARAVLLSHCAHQWTNLGESLYAFISNAGALALLWAGCGLPEIFAIRLLGASLRLLLMTWRAVSLEPYYLWPCAPFDRAGAKKLAGLSGHAMMINFSIIISHKIDDLVIASFLPLSAVGVYEVVFRFVGVTIQVCLKLCEGVYPLFSRLAAERDKAGAARLFLRMSALLNLVACLLLMLVVCHYRELFALFSAGKIPIAQTLPVLAIAVPTVLSGALQMPANAWLFTWGRQRYLTVSSLLTALANLLLSLALVRPLGIAGVALGTLIPQLAQHQGSLIRTTCRALDISAGRYLSAVHGAILLPLLVSFLWIQGWGWLPNPFAHPLPAILLTSASAVLIAGWLWFRRTAGPEERQFVRAVWREKLRPWLPRLPMSPDLNP